METAATNDEGEPSRLLNKIYPATLLLLLILLAAACNEKKKATVIRQPAIDSTAILQREKALQDSLTKARTAVRKKRIYLTFDDGPNKGTMNVLNAVKEDSIPASFFIVGTHTDDSPKQRETWNTLQADSSIALCNHSYSHAGNRYTKYYSYPAGVVQDIEHNNQALSFENNIVRMPGRNAWRIDTVLHNDIKKSAPAFDSVYAAGFDIMGWDVEWVFDHKTLHPDTATGLLLRRIQNMLEAGKTRTKENLVLLAHDQSFQSEGAVNMLHYLFRELKNNPEYELALVIQYPGIRKTVVTHPLYTAADSTK